MHTAQVEFGKTSVRIGVPCRRGDFDRDVPAKKQNKQ